METKRKRILVTASNASTLNAMYTYLYHIFSPFVEIEKTLICKSTKEKEDLFDLIVFPNHPTKRTTPRFISEKKVLFCNRVYDYRNLEGLFAFEPNTKVYFVNDNPYVVKEAMNQLIDLGVIHFELIPYYPGKAIDPTIVNGITAGEGDYAPEQITKLVDLGARIPCLSDISTIVHRLGLPTEIVDKVSKEYVTQFAQNLSKSSRHLQRQYKTQQILNNIFNHIDQGVCLVDKEGCIKTVNRKFFTGLSLKKERVIGAKLEVLLNELDVNIQVDDVLSCRHMVIPWGDTEMYIAHEIVDDGMGGSHLIYIDFAKNINEKEAFIRKNQPLQKGLKKYTFKDFVTYDPHMKNVIEKAKKISKNNSSVLIQGESGTGKEIIAQAIHFASRRKEFPFVPVNFAAIQPNLLDSELFGYVDGAFTGAIKGGSKGLIEMAHKGTVFFDEIGDAPLHFQVRLLRVLQEKEIRRVGSSERIPIDVRIIAATNKNLLDMMEKGRFREDLFFRISTMPLDLIPLRDRAIDIERLYTDTIRSVFNDNDLTLSDLCRNDVVDFLYSYKYKGNVREMKNIVEYFHCIKGARRIGFEDLPKYMLRTDYKNAYQLSESECEILKVIESHPKIGRRKIREILADRFDLSEGEIRTILNKMRKEAYIVINNTRGGCELTHQGKVLLHAIQ